MFKIEDTSNKGQMHIKQPWLMQAFDEWKFNMESEPGNQDIILELPWEQTHRKWDENYECWVMDLSGLYTAMFHLAENGCEVTVTDDVLKKFKREFIDG